MNDVVRYNRPLQLEQLPILYISSKQKHYKKVLQYCRRLRMHIKTYTHLVLRK